MHNRVLNLSLRISASVLVLYRILVLPMGTPIVTGFAVSTCLSTTAKRIPTP